VGPTLRELREAAESCARIGGAVLRDARAAGPNEVREKGRHDFVTEVDAASEAAIAAALRERFPGHFLLAEEAAAGAGSWRAVPLRETGSGDGGAEPELAAGAESAAGFASEGAVEATDGRSRGDAAPRPDRIEWIVDPLDGTTNFIHGFPVFAVSIAARGPDGLLAGVVYDPTRDELFSAARGEGARLNGEAIRVSAVSEPARALVGTGFPFRNARFTEPYLESFERVFAAVSDIRRAGSASVDLAYVACGRLDGFWELGLSPWDTAAGWLLIEEAGGVVTDDRGGSDVFGRGHVVAGGPAVHRTLLEIARTSFGEKVEPRAGAADVPGARR
jgi:myo-inositol-1(or 4)-monophosphatase